MKWVGAYLIGFVILLVGVLLALNKAGILATIGPVWTAIGVLILIGIGVMAAAGTRSSKTLEVDKG